MAAFQFRLASVLRFRERLKEEKEWELGLLFDRRRRQETEIEALEEERQRAERATLDDQEAIYTAIELQRRGEYAETLARRILVKRAELGPTDQAIAAKREELAGALRDVKTLEQLRDRWAEQFRIEQNAVEQRAADETGQRKFTRRDVSS